MRGTGKAFCGVCNADTQLFHVPRCQKLVRTYCSLLTDLEWEDRVPSSGGFEQPFLKDFLLGWVGRFFSFDMDDKDEERVDY